MMDVAESPETPSRLCDISSQEILLDLTWKVNKMLSLD